MAETVSASSAIAAAPSLFKKRTNKSSIRKRPATPPPIEESDSSGYTTSEDDAGHKVKRRRRDDGLVTAKSSSTHAHPTAEIDSTTKFAANRSSAINPSDDATKTSNWYDEATTEKDTLSARDLLGTTRPQQTPPSTTNNEPTYRGTTAYTSFVAKNPNAPSRAPIGPVKAPTNIRTITVTDFAPDVCKDYKQTGFCGFGDSCKFLHAREDYKQGWELDREWDVLGKERKRGGTRISKSADNGDEAEEADEAMLENIPFACIICREAYKNPIVTKCGHYFCEKCALNRYRKKPDCAACGAGTGGVFNGAKGLKRLLERKRERAKARREKAMAEGEDVSSADDEEEEEEV